nr:late-embryogenesis-abundant protein homolog [Onoclea sensibilis=sensitive fern, spores, Peptide Partial, 89 aa] [Onoclea sensibilis]
SYKQKWQTALSKLRTLPPTRRRRRSNLGSTRQARPGHGGRDQGQGRRVAQATQDKAQQAKDGAGNVFQQAGDAVKGAADKVTGGGGAQH